MLPSIRGLATDLGVSVLTTNKAYDNLVNSGIISAVKGKGFFVSLDMERFQQDNKLKIEQLILQAVKCSQSAQIPKDRLFEIIKIVIEKEME